MKKANWKGLREDTGKKIGERVYFAGDIENIVSHLGANRSRETINNNLRGKAIKPNKIGINLFKYGLDDVNLYKESDVWAYLQELAKKGKINLGANAVDSMWDIVFRRWYRPPIRLPYMRRKIIGRVSREGEFSGSDDNITRVYEDS